MCSSHMITSLRRVVQNFRSKLATHFALPDETSGTKVFVEISLSKFTPRHSPPFRCVSLRATAVAPLVSLKVQDWSKIARSAPAPVARGVFCTGDGAKYTRSSLCQGTPFTGRNEFLKHLIKKINKLIKIKT